VRVPHAFLVRQRPVVLGWTAIARPNPGHARCRHRTTVVAVHNVDHTVQTSPPSVMRSTSLCRRQTASGGTPIVEDAVSWSSHNSSITSWCGRVVSLRLYVAAASHDETYLRMLTIYDLYRVAAGARELVLYSSAVAVVSSCCYSARLTCCCCTRPLEP